MSLERRMWHFVDHVFSGCHDCSLEVLWSDVVLVALVAVLQLSRLLEVFLHMD